MFPLFAAIQASIANIMASNAAMTSTRTTSATALRVTGAAVAPAEPQPVDAGQWEGARCCPKCLTPFPKQSGIPPECCPACGHTQTTMIIPAVRARRRVHHADGSEGWQWKDGKGDGIPTPR